MAADGSSIYNRIGDGYSVGRREDPRIAARIWAALGDARSVVNIGAGTGSYEPREREVVAVEPSEVMVAQRPPESCPVVQAVAEALPFPDDSFDAAMAVLTLHHWTDKTAGLAEMRRVARERCVLFLRDPAQSPRWWLYDYFPATERLFASWETPLDQVQAALGAVESVPVPIPADCIDGFDAAYWRRPWAIHDPAVWGAMSALTLIPDDDRQRGFDRLRADLAGGQWERRFGHLFELEELDLGYRVVIAAKR